MGRALPIGARQMEPSDAAALGGAFFGSESSVYENEDTDPFWRCTLLSGFAEESQYERLIRLARQGRLPDGVACIARAGSAFQGFRGRGWLGAPGNVQLSVHLAPMRAIDRFETVFLALAAVSAVDAIDAVPGLRAAAGIKWVNDIVMGGAKVGGVLAYTQSRGNTVTSVVLGLGLNVEVLPVVAPTAFVPQVTSLREHALRPEQVRSGEVLRLLMEAIARNYRSVLEVGYRPLMDRYRSRSSVLGMEVSLSADHADEVPRVFASGRITAIGDGLELFLDRSPDPVTRGRLIVSDPSWGEDTARATGQEAPSPFLPGT